MRRRRRRRWAWLVLFVVVIACATRNRGISSGSHETRGATPTAASSSHAPALPNPSPAPSYFVTPSPRGLAPVAEAIASAKTSIKMIMFHLSERSMVEALLAAKARGVDVRIILDEKNLKSKSAKRIADELTSHGVVVTPSSPSFSITHAKAMIIDDRRALVMSLNLTTIYEKTRDYAVMTDDPNAVAEFSRVFDADVENAAGHTKKTPPLSCTKLLWSPVTSEAKLVGLVDSAARTIVASSENLGDSAIEAALARAASRHVSVRLLSPMCDMNPNPLFNVPIVKRMDSEGIDARLMPGPSSPERPYIHAKMMIVDGARGYVGSINFSENSTHQARELGIVVDDPNAIRAFSQAFESDWSQAVMPPADPSGVCGKHADAEEGPDPFEGRN